LQDIIDLTKDEALKPTFPTFRRFWLYFKPLPFGVKGLQVLEGIDPDSYEIRSHDAQMLYREISFFWNQTGPGGISANTHTAIADYFILILLTLMANR